MRWMPLEEKQREEFKATTAGISVGLPRGVGWKGRGKGCTVMDPTKPGDEQTFMPRMTKGATIGLVPGILWGAFATVAHLEPPPGRIIVFPGLIPALKITGSKGLICAGTGVLWVGVELLLEKCRMKRDVINEAAAGFVAGAAFGGRNTSIAMSAGAAFANTAIFLDALPRYRETLKRRSGK